ncbi:unnamed protein product [Parnassius apollo]|uniref:(apollo) hypothetical protein n=1 Tax=Parnassius apollo TaxID=110799 RepID=A0A8S3XME0_PARAO|nr:unnamed protein product [Parnassius apollo]
MCDDKGFAYDFEIYSGAENDPELRLPDECDLGASSNIVVRLCRSVPRNQNYKIFFDNYYTSPELISYLSKKGIHTLGTVNKGRMGMTLKMPSQKELTAAKKPRGYSEGWVATVDAVPVSAVLWLDSKSVVLASSFVGEQPKYKSTRRRLKRLLNHTRVTRRLRTELIIANKEVENLNVTNRKLNKKFLEQEKITKLYKSVSIYDVKLRKTANNSYNSTPLSKPKKQNRKSLKSDTRHSFECVERIKLKETLPATQPEKFVNGGNPFYVESLTSKIKTSEETC